MKLLAKYALPVITLFSLSVPAYSFGLTFDWSDLNLCTTGRPNIVQNPTFTLQDVPAGTTTIIFKLVDTNVRSYNHGGGTVNYTGNSTIQPGAFRYKSPCPPNGSHIYRWTATARDASGTTLDTTYAQKRYPD